MVWLECVERAGIEFEFYNHGWMSMVVNFLIGSMRDCLSMWSGVQLFWLICAGFCSVLQPLRLAIKVCFRSSFVYSCALELLPIVMALEWWVAHSDYLSFSLYCTCQGLLVPSALLEVARISITCRSWICSFSHNIIGKNWCYALEEFVLILLLVSYTAEARTKVGTS